MPRPQARARRPGLTRWRRRPPPTATDARRHKPGRPRPAAAGSVDARAAAWLLSRPMGSSPTDGEPGPALVHSSSTLVGGVALAQQRPAVERRAGAPPSGHRRRPPAPSATRRSTSTSPAPFTTTTSVVQVVDRSFVPGFSVTMPAPYRQRERSLARTAPRRPARRSARPRPAGRRSPARSRATSTSGAGMVAGAEQPVDQRRARGCGWSAPPPPAAPDRPAATAPPWPPPPGRRGRPGAPR